MATVSPTFTKPAELPFDIVQEQARIARKQKMVDALAEQSIQYRGNTEMAGNVAIKRSPFEALAQALTGGVLGYADKSLADRADALPGKLDQINKSEMARVQELAKTDPVAAQHAGETSSSPLVRALFERTAERDAEMRKMLGEKGAGASTGSSVVQAAQTGSLNALTPKAPAISEKAGVLFNEETGQPMPALPQEAQFRANERPDGSVDYISRQTGKGTAGGAPRTTINTNTSIINKGQQKGSETHYTLAEKQLAEAEDALNAGSSMRGTLNEMKQLDQAGMFNGTGAEQIMAVAKAGQQLGLNFRPDALANAEAYRSAQTQLWQTLVSKMGGNKGVTKEEAEEIKMILPRVTDSPLARQRILQILDNSHVRAVARYDMLSKALQEGYNADNPSASLEAKRKAYVPQGPGTPIVPAAAMPASPSNSATSPSKPMTAAEFLKQRGR